MGSQVLIGRFGGMKFKFGEVVEKKLSIKIRGHSDEIFSIFALIPV